MIKIMRNFKISGGKPHGTKEAQKQRNLCSCENFAAKRVTLRKEASPVKTFRSQKSHPAKMGLCCKNRAPLRNNFAATRPLLRNHPQAHVCHFATQKPIS